MADLRQDIGADQQDETRARKYSLQCRYSVDRIARAEPRLDVEHADAAIAGKLARRGETLGQGCHAAHRLQRVLRRHQPPDLVEVEALQRLAADMEMAFMRRVEGPAEKADAARRQPTDAQAMRRQRRTCGTVLRKRSL